MLGLRLIPEWRRAWRMGSVVASALLAVLSAIQAELLPIVQPLFAPEQWPKVSGAIALLIIVLRLILQRGVRPDEGSAASAEEERHL